MPRGPGLGGYLAKARKGAAAPFVASLERPRAEVLWAHATSAGALSALRTLAGRLAQVRPGTRMLLTCREGLAGPPPDELLLVERLPEDQPVQIAGFLDHWRPDLCLWTGGYLRPALLGAVAQRRIAMILAEAEQAGFEQMRMRWLPDVTRSALAAFDTVQAVDQATAQRLLRLGVPPAALTVTGRLQAGGITLPCDPPDRDRLAGLLSGRPVWMAALVHPDELTLITAAHRAALGLAHRLLLVLVPDDDALGGSFAAALDAEGWRVAHWSRGDLPGETTQVVLADQRAARGLWYRLAPVTLMGNSLASGMQGRDPFEAAALGSAILYGPNVSHHLAAYSRLATAGAARIVRDVPTLQASVIRMIAPDAAASMANAAWDVATAGAEVTDQLVDLIQDRLDMAGGG